MFQFMGVIDQLGAQRLQQYVGIARRELRRRSQTLHGVLAPIRIGNGKETAKSLACRRVHNLGGRLAVDARPREFFIAQTARLVVMQLSQRGPQNFRLIGLQVFFLLALEPLFRLADMHGRLLPVLQRRRIILVAPRVLAVIDRCLRLRLERGCVGRLPWPQPPGADAERAHANENGNQSKNSPGTTTACHVGAAFRDTRRLQGRIFRTAKFQFTIQTGFVPGFLCAFFAPVVMLRGE